MVYEEKRFFYHNKYDTLSTYCFCNWINHLEKGTPLKYKFKMPKPSKAEKHYHYRFQEFHLGFQKDPLPLPLSLTVPCYL